MTIYNFYTIRELAPQQHECFPDMNFGYNSGRVKNRIYLPDTFVGATYYFDGEFSNRYGTSQIDDDGHPYIDINFNDGEIGNGTVFIIAGKRYCTFPYTLEYVNVFETEIDVSEIDTSNLVTKQTFDNTVERIDSDITTGDTANRTAIDQLTAATNQRFADVNTKLSGYDEQIGAVDTEVKNLASEVDGYSTDITKAVADAADAKSVAEGAADDAATADAAAKEAQTAVGNLTTRVGAVENSVETAETTANEAKSAAQAAQATAGEAQTSAANAKSRADEAYTLAETAQSDAEGANEKATTAQSTADGVKTRVDTIDQTTIPEINETLGRANDAIMALNSSLTNVATRVDNIEENYNTLNDSVGLLTTQVQSIVAGSELTPHLYSLLVYQGEATSINVSDELDSRYQLKFSNVLGLVCNFYGATGRFRVEVGYTFESGGSAYPGQTMQFNPSANFDTGNTYYLIMDFVNRRVGMYEIVALTGELKVTDGFATPERLISWFEFVNANIAALTITASAEDVTVNARVGVNVVSNIN